MKKLNKVLSIVMIVLMIACTTTNLFAISIDNLKNSGSTSAGATELQKIGGTILNFITNAAMILAVVVVAVIGVKYMMGSVEEKAEYKKSMMPYIIGAVLVFGASLVGKMVYNFGTGMA